MLRFAQSCFWSNKNNADSFVPLDLPSGVNIPDSDYHILPYIFMDCVFDTHSIGVFPVLSITILVRLQDAIIYYLIGTKPKPLGYCQMPQPLGKHSTRGSARVSFESIFSNISYLVRAASNASNLELGSFSNPPSRSPHSNARWKTCWISITHSVGRCLLLSRTLRVFYYITHTHMQL